MHSCVFEALASPVANRVHCWRRYTKTMMMDTPPGSVSSLTCHFRDHAAPHTTMEDTIEDGAAQGDLLLYQR